ncbi:MAG: o-succinylbenzoate synthase [Calditrichaeota bacterium]|nr:MAG: o-succinylbenzoate synthase [Calditrichota bacterium]
MTAEFRKFILPFKKPLGTSRGVLHERETYIIALRDTQGHLGLGEAAPLKDLSMDCTDDFSEKLHQICREINRGKNPLELEVSQWPAIQFGLEAAWLDLKQGGAGLLYRTPFTQGKESIPLHGLVTMGEVQSMYEQALQKIEQGFTWVKFKIGAHDFAEECAMLSELRRRFPEVEIRLDANGAFSPEEALEKLNYLAQFRIHSVEQPIKPGQWEAMASLCQKSPIPMALDEELIGIFEPAEKQELLQTIQPQFIVLKPTLLGGLKASEEWIALAREDGIGFWVNSMLESNIGLNILAQWTSTLKIQMPQGLGTGRLFNKNFELTVKIDNGHMAFLPEKLPRQLQSLEQLHLVDFS